MWIPEYTRQFKKDYKRCKKRGLPESEIETIMRLLLQGMPLAEKHRDHTLKGEYDGHGECHIRPDWLLIYFKDKARKALVFVRTGTHGDLFERNAVLPSWRTSSRR
jgi:mRNA interferase YafQ